MTTWWGNSHQHHTHNKHAQMLTIIKQQGGYYTEREHTKLRCEGLSDMAKWVKIRSIKGRM